MQGARRVEFETSGEACFWQPGSRLAAKSTIKDGCPFVLSVGWQANVQRMHFGATPRGLPQGGEGAVDYQFSTRVECVGSTPQRIFACEFVAAFLLAQSSPSQSGLLHHLHRSSCLVRLQSHG